jgi:hypothetical protein
MWGLEVCYDEYGVDLWEVLRNCREVLRVFIEKNECANRYNNIQFA